MNLSEKSLVPKKALQHRTCKIVQSHELNLDVQEFVSMNRKRRERSLKTWNFSVLPSKVNIYECVSEFSLAEASIFLYHLLEMIT